jgi:hypothetical protein
MSMSVNTNNHGGSASINGMPMMAIGVHGGHSPDKHKKKDSSDDKKKKKKDSSSDKKKKHGGASVHIGGMPAMQMQMPHM